MAEAEERTAATRALTLNVALSLRRALGHRAGGARAGARARAAGALAPGGIDEAAVRPRTRARRRCPNPDLFIRTGGEQRISNFLLWNLAYTELYFCDSLWPDFDDAEFDAALAAFRRPRSGASA